MRTLVVYDMLKHYLRNIALETKFAGTKLLLNVIALSLYSFSFPLARPLLLLLVFWVIDGTKKAQFVPKLRDRNAQKTSTFLTTISCTTYYKQHKEVIYAIFTGCYIFSVTLIAFFLSYPSYPVADVASLSSSKLQHQIMNWGKVFVDKRFVFSKYTIC